ncbi:HPr family phosphocarrier protein [Parasutterella muris]|jgi:Phosphotransferase System HPr (HPr) Family|uniref:HPr family phosphocarrier protein n=1 Tax=Parasutterella muris TaxID=2565572 RepID=A0A6L6YL20_9BURK|nr:HPr family phosphocarrier protein [Parasutterella muris]MVX55801.1 HPr family phosphocarrier protein [Parasutterella muris]
MKSIQVTVLNRLGLHARPAAKLTQKGNEFLSDIRIEKGGRKVNGKSIMGVMLLAASKGTELTVTADGTDEDAALAAVKELFDSKFGEQE